MIAPICFDISLVSVEVEKKTLQQVETLLMMVR